MELKTLRLEQDRKEFQLALRESEERSEERDRRADRRLMRFGIMLGLLIGGAQVLASILTMTQESWGTSFFKACARMMSRLAGAFLK